MDFEDIGCLLVFVLVIFVIVFVATGNLPTLMNSLCERQYSGIGYPTRWISWAGCQIEVEPGMWIPGSSYYYKDE